MHLLFTVRGTPILLPKSKLIELRGFCYETNVIYELFIKYLFNYNGSRLISNVYIRTIFPLKL